MTAFGEGEGRRLREEGMCRIKPSLGGRCQGVKGLLVAFGYIRLEFPLLKCHQRLLPMSWSKPAMPGARLRQDSVQLTCDAPGKQFPFTFAMTVTALPGRAGITHQLGLKCSWVLPMLQADILKGWVVVMFYWHTIRRHLHHALKQLIHLLTSRW